METTPYTGSVPPSGPSAPTGFPPSGVFYPPGVEPPAPGPPRSSPPRYVHRHRAGTRASPAQPQRVRAAAEYAQLRTARVRTAVARPLPPRSRRPSQAAAVAGVGRVRAAGRPPRRTRGAPAGRGLRAAGAVTPFPSTARWPGGRCRPTPSRERRPSSPRRTRARQRSPRRTPSPSRRRGGAGEQQVPAYTGTPAAVAGLALAEPEAPVEVPTLDPLMGLPRAETRSARTCSRSRSCPSRCRRRPATAARRPSSRSPRTTSRSPRRSG